MFIRGISGVEIADKSTVRVRISENPRLALKGLALIMMVSPTALKANEEVAGRRCGRGAKPLVARRVTVTVPPGFVEGVITWTEGIQRSGFPDTFATKASLEPRRRRGPVPRLPGSSLDLMRSPR